MTINPLSSGIINILSSNDAQSFDSSKILDLAESPGRFSDILSEALSTAAQADKEDKASALELLMGKSDDLSGLLLDAQKAELSLNLALQIRNKVVDAYNEMMRMQV